MTPAIIDHLKSAVPGLGNRVYGAAALAALMAKEAVPNVTPCAHVIPTGIAGKPNPNAMAGAIIQGIDRGFAVILSLKAHDQNGEQVLDEVSTFIDQIALALVGWTPGNTVGVFQMRRAVLASFAHGVAIYEIDFVIQDQLRKAT